MIDMSPPDVSQGRFPSFEACSNAPGGKCFSPGSEDIAYESAEPCLESVVYYVVVVFATVEDGV